MNHRPTTLSEEITIPFGETWQGFEFVRIRRYKRRKGYRTEFVRRYWSGKFRTLASRQASTADEIVEAIRELLLPIFEVPDEVVERIRAFCSSTSGRARESEGENT